MGMLGKLVTGSLLARALRRHEERERLRDRHAAEGQYIPASDLAASRGALAGRGNAIVGRAGRFYRDNPTLVHALAATAGAILLTRMRRR
ncbi:MAG TPA: hypothetical protein VFE23_05700 [Usitatibacter sp.]|jgi:hypothetical protein|nr:hypothetical protein [Usitatibacter sp.]